MRTYRQLFIFSLIGSCLLVGCTADETLSVVSMNVNTAHDVEVVSVTLRNGTDGDVTLHGANVPCNVRLVTELPLTLTQGNQAEILFEVPAACRKEGNAITSLISSPAKAAIDLEL